MQEKRIGVELRALHNLLKRRVEASPAHLDFFNQGVQSSPGPAGGQNLAQQLGGAPGPLLQASLNQLDINRSLS